MEHKTLKVDGMSCEHCVKAVHGAVDALEGLSGVSVDLENGTVSFDYDPAQVPLAAIEAAITGEGYEIARG